MICCGYDFPNTCKSHEAHCRPSNFSVLKIQIFISFLLCCCHGVSDIRYFTGHNISIDISRVQFDWRLLVWVTFSPEINKRWLQLSWMLAGVVRWPRQSVEEKWWLWRVPLGVSLVDISLSKYFAEQAIFLSVIHIISFISCCLIFRIFIANVKFDVHNISNNNYQYQYSAWFIYLLFILISCCCFFNTVWNNCWRYRVFFSSASCFQLDISCADLKRPRNNNASDIRSAQ